LELPTLLDFALHVGEAASMTVNGASERSRPPPAGCGLWGRLDGDGWADFAGVGDDSERSMATQRLKVVAVYARPKGRRQDGCISGARLKRYLRPGFTQQR